MIYGRWDNLEARFWPKVNKNGPVMRVGLGPCWEWTGFTARGYGRFGLGEHIERAHRVAFLMAHGRWPIQHALHRCDNPACVKAWDDEAGPSHVYEGTHEDNMRDRNAKGRANLRRGDSYWTPKRVAQVERRRERSALLRASKTGSDTNVP